MRSNFECTVNSSLVVELVSLEVSVVRSGSRVVLAYINRSERSLPVSLADSLSLSTGDTFTLSDSFSLLSLTEVDCFSLSFIC